MKRSYFVSLLLAFSLSLSAGNLQAQIIPGIGNISGLINRAIKAIDLKIQRMQNKTIGLQNAQKVIENAMSKLHLKDIAGWAERQKSLYDQYFRQLWQVKTVLTSYWKVKEIIQRQVQLVSEYNSVWGILKNDDHFSVAELNQMYRVYGGILTESLRNLDQLMLACSMLTTQMSDGKRMQLIVDAGKYIEKNLADLRSFNNSNVRLSLARAVDLADQLITRKMYGIQ
ncbi:hypothetical protein SAMN05192529_10951 [Arachidicoccus rhizosphaerae]|uniref:Conjugal transfer protein TraI n=1 Tax=Arachidicoccus rhizosphaerae TaxID=551991 RepID=A0A1H3YV58_9BACT|nr:hypothetical protein [Arachidicoccus rhizosphaerae]SEA14978.1 hypothetical protein SAMN05192529_10951 [Arachidicoccus rhizosphaerae]